MFDATALALVGAAFYLILDRIYLNELKSQAETVADNVDAFGRSPSSVKRSPASSGESTAPTGPQ